MNATTKIVEQYNLTDDEWEEGADGVYLSPYGWHVRKGSYDGGPWKQREFAEEAAPEFFE